MGPQPEAMEIINRPLYVERRNAMSGQPDDANMKFDITAVEAQEVGGIAPSIVVNAGNTFNMLVTTSLTGPWAAFGAKSWYDPGPPIEGAAIEHHALNLETGVVTLLPYQVPAGPASLLVGVNQATTGPYTTGAGMDLDVGTYQITTHIHLTPGTGIQHLEAAFFVSNLMIII
jgi:hypothetical protein